MWTADETKQDSSAAGKTEDLLLRCLPVQVLEEDAEQDEVELLLDADLPGLWEAVLCTA